MTERRPPRRPPSERYVVERTLGRGGMATVYLAHDHLLDRPVALKVLAEHLADEPDYRARFLREARLAAKLVHPSVVSVYDVGEDERGPFIVMEYVEGETLHQALRSRGRFPAAEVIAIGIQLCSALEAAHAERLVHRDIKPQNILRRPDGRVKLADFGIARSLAATRHTEIGTVLGTAAYLSPEQARGDQVTAAADIYSLGVVLYELLTGRTPFTAETLSELVLKREQGAVTPPSEVAPETPAALEDVIMRCLALQPEYRPASAAVLASELAASSDEPVTEPLPDASGLRATEVMLATSATTPLHRARAGRGEASGRSRPRLLVVGLAAAALLGLAAIFAVLGGFGSGSGDSGVKDVMNPARTTTARSTTTDSTTTRSTTTRVSTVAQVVQPATPTQALAGVRAAIAAAQTQGQLDPKAAGDLGKKLDEIAKSLSAGKSDEAARKVTELTRRLGDLARDSGKISSAAVIQVSASLGQLATLVTVTQAAPAAPPAPAHGHGKKPKKKGKKG